MEIFQSYRKKILSKFLLSAIFMIVIQLALIEPAFGWKSQRERFEEVIRNFSRDPELIASRLEKSGFHPLFKEKYFENGSFKILAPLSDVKHETLTESVGETKLVHHLLKPELK